MIESKNILDNIIQVNSSSGGFYNPSKSHRMGTFYLEFNEANPKSISFKYDGHINISLSKSIVGAKVRHYSSRNSVIIDFPPNCKFENDLIFSFTGNLKLVKSLKIHNWKGKVLSPKFIQYDQTNLYVNYSKTNFEDETTGVWKNMEITEVDNSEIDEILNNPLTYPSRRRPIYVRRKNFFTEGSNTNSHNLVIDIYPSFDTDITVSVEYFKKPKHPMWGFVVVNQKPLYNLNTSINFELHPSEEEPLVTRILTLAGVAIEKPGLVQGAMADQQVTKQNQNS